MTKPILTQAYLKECLSYDPETGVFTWLRRPREHFKCNWSWKVHWRKDGKEAGYLDPTGYVHIRLQNTLYKAHRLAFFYMTGKWPAQEIDHINHARADNRLANLREATRTENVKNASRRTDNVTGQTGVCFDNRKRRWLVQISYGGKNRQAGRYINFEDAVKARKAAEIKYGYHENHGLCQ